MSAFLVSTECMDRIVAALTSKGEYEQVVRVFAGIATSDPAAPAKIGRKLYGLNWAALRARYPDAQEFWAEGGTLPRSYTTSFTTQAPCARLPLAELAAGIKALQCLAYQCAEGDVPKRKLFQEMVRATGALAEEYVWRTPDYQAAPWG